MEWLRVWRIRIFLQVGAIDIWKQCKNAKYFKVAKKGDSFSLLSNSPSFPFAAFSQYGWRVG